MAAKPPQNGCWGKSYEALGFRKGYNFPLCMKTLICLEACTYSTSSHFCGFNARILLGSNYLPGHQWKRIDLIQVRSCSRGMVLVSARTRTSRHNDPSWMHRSCWTSHGGTTSHTSLHHLVLTFGSSVAIRTHHPPQIHPSSPYQRLHCHCLGHDFECGRTTHHQAVLRGHFANPSSNGLTRHTQLCLDRNGVL
jgi:hypothetical protein